MGSLKDLVRSAQAGEHLVVTGPHSRWLERLETEQVPNFEAMLHVLKSFLLQYKRPRTGRISPSAMGECARRIVFGYAGAPQLPPDIDNQEMMDHGSIAHLKWQVEGLTMGYMTKVEHWVHDPDLLLGGSIDGVLEDDSLFELKTAAMGIYNKIVHQQREPKFENLMQLGSYFLLYDTDWASVVYEDRGLGKFHEFRVQRSSKYEREILRRLASYKAYIEEDELPPMLADCELKMGAVYRRCPYRAICASTTSPTAAGALQVDPEKGRTEEIVLPEWAAPMLAALEQVGAVYNQMETDND